MSENQKEIKVVLADDHLIFRQGLRRVLDAQNGITLLAEASDGEEALEVIIKSNPDVAILDISMPKMDGLGVAKALRTANSKVHIIFLTMNSEEEFLEEALNIGAKGYILKDNSEEDLIRAVKAVVSGKSYISPLMSDFMIKQRNKALELKEKVPGLHSLTPQERKILSLLALNHTSLEIGGKLFISTRTVQNHRANIAEKLSMKGPNKLLEFALKNKSLL